MTLTTVLVLAAGTYAVRLGGVLLRERVAVPEHVRRLFALSAIALLAALYATNALVDGEGFAGWARALGVGAGALLAVARLPFVFVVIGAALTTAGLRLVGIT
ncbi:AzlD domain-containing protein [Allokutzneria albata]|uniref:Branched-chain amino acid transport protein (AzlD) n=1 Tax=Allokutzneria albata TaxID=211114 RepID=A0A1H0DFF9_ALLAB|nr:AzlD domain-containing protein [Allokutzneria albata]SDN68842.1 Branched-chain amino acid transport protein (AzlD) [Allokutzneria albata]